MRYPQTREVSRVKRKRKEALEVVLPGRGANDLSRGRKGLPRGPGIGGNYTD